MIQRHLKREYEKELIINTLGYVQHEKCNKVDFIFQQILQILPNEKEKIIENRAKLQYYWAHQARKTYLNAQFNAALLRLDENGAVIIADYKMKILPQSA